MTAFSTGDPLSAESQLSKQTLDTCDHYYKAKDELSKLQRTLSNREKEFTSALSAAIPPVSPEQMEQALALTASGSPVRELVAFIKALGITGKTCRLVVKLGVNILKINNQIDRLHARIKNLRKGLHELATKEIAIQLILTGATALACENLEGLDVAGKKGSVAIAGFNMPDEPAVIIRAVRNTNARYRELDLPLEVVIDPQDPRGTSSIHAGCGGELERLPGQWDMATCKKCGQAVNTHASAAINIKFLSQGIPLVPVSPVPPVTPDPPPVP